MKKIITALLLMAVMTYAQERSVIVTAEGASAMGSDKSRKQTKEDALILAKRDASEKAGTYIKSETTVKNYMTESDLVQSFSGAEIKVLKVIKEEWIKDETLGETLKLTIEAEVIPSKIGGNEITTAKYLDDPTAPLTVSVWCDKKEKSYKNGEVIKIYLKGNKPFYGKVLYKQVDGTLLQILPNPHRADNYFNGGTMYELPSGKDQYSLEISEPFGTENIIVYASTNEIGSGNVEKADAVFAVKDDLQETGVKTRGIKIKAGKDSKSSSPAEFFETKLEIVTGK